MHINILTLIIQCVTLYTKWLHDKQLIEAGKAQGIIEGLENVKAQIKIGNNAIAHANEMPVSADKYNRDRES